MTVTGAAAVGERIEITGVVQGVGLRPFVFRHATDLGLVGWVGNDSSRVCIEVAGEPGAIDELVARLVDHAPPLARIEQVRRRPVEPPQTADFVIADSRSATGHRTLVPPDTAVCDECVAELFDPANRRHRHPFITCTDCGPRFSIITDLPYDRPATTMAPFALSAECAEEYADPSDRRFHAQPICCHRCGPVLWLRREGAPGRAGSRALDAARQVLANGLIVMVKGIGGFHLAAQASDAAGLARLRERKARPDKPFAVMVRDLDQAHALAHIDAAEAELLSSAARPIVLLWARSDSPLAAEVAPGNPLIGVVLAYTPLHHLLLEEPMAPLVMTSANLAGEPIAHRDEQIQGPLGGLADAVLTHDRPIHSPCDDSVVRVVAGATLPVRRARGYAPLPVPMRDPRRSVLAVGSELKNTFCLTSNDHAWVSQHLGDMADLGTIEAFATSVDRFQTLYGVVPEVVAVDAHPGYQASRWARTHHGDRVVEVQHHHAHIAAVMAEHQLDPTQAVIGFAFDGTGYGSDGTIWGGEVLVASAVGFERAAHLAPVPLPGGDAAIANPSRVALAHLWAAGLDWTDDLAPVAATTETERRVLRHQLESGLACVPTTSMGRLFDAIASLVDLRHQITYEAQAAIDLEGAAAGAGTHVVDGYRFAVDGSVVDPAGVVAAVVADLAAHVPVEVIARRFHLGVADLVRALACRIRADRALDTVVLSGGVFQNALLTEMCGHRLRAAGFDPLVHRLVPPNDGGLALGQAFVAAHARSTGTA